MATDIKASRNGRCYKNGQLTESIPLSDRAFHYGDGCFTTARIYKGCLELEHRHFTRLVSCCKALSLSVDLSLIEKCLEQLKTEFSPLNGTLKIVISRGESPRGYAFPKHAADLYVWFYPQQMDIFTPQLIKSGTLTQALGLTMPQMVGLKTLNRLEQVLLKQEADQHGWPEALVTDVQGGVVEGVSSNCFIYLNDTWITPELRYNGVHGIMRAEILSRMQACKLPVEQRFIDMEEVSSFQALFFCNALHPMKAVTEFAGKSLDARICVDLFHTLQLDQIH